MPTTTQFTNRVDRAAASAPAQLKLMIETLDNLRATLIEASAVYDPAYPISADLARELVIDTRAASDRLRTLACEVYGMNPFYRAPGSGTLPE